MDTVAQSFRNLSGFNLRFVVSAPMTFMMGVCAIVGLACFGVGKRYQEKANRVAIEKERQMWVTLLEDSSRVDAMRRSVALFVDQLEKEIESLDGYGAAGELWKVYVSALTSGDVQADGLHPDSPEAQVAISLKRRAVDGFRLSILDQARRVLGDEQTIQLADSMTKFEAALRVRAFAKSSV